MLLRIVFLTALIASIFPMTSCKSKKMNSSDDAVLYSMHRGACFGFCPVFDVSILKNGKALLHATRYNKNNGKFEKQLSKSQLKHFQQMYKDVNLRSMPDEFPTMVADLPSTILTDHTLDKPKSVRANEKMPDAYETLVDSFESLAQSDGWILIEKYPDDPSNGRDVRQQETIYDEIIIEPNVGVRLPVWLKEMEAYGVQLIKKIANEQNLWLITFDTKMIEPNLMLHQLKKDKSIKFAEFNKKITNRD